MENDIALVTAGYVLSRIGILAAFGYLFYRVLTFTPARKQAVYREQQRRERIQGNLRYR